MRRNIYEGPRSCYAIREGVYAYGKGVNLRTGVSILYLILRDLERGWTYDHNCRPIRMDYRLFVRRARYLYPLCLKHAGDKTECRVLKNIIEYAIKHHRLPSEALPYVRIVEHGKPVTMVARPLPQAWRTSPRPWRAPPMLTI